MSKSGPITGQDTARDSTGVVEFTGPLPADLVRAIGWLRDHLSEPVRLDILAQIAGVRPRTLETHFKAFLGTTPLGWVRRMRLARAGCFGLPVLSGPRARTTSGAVTVLPAITDAFNCVRTCSGTERDASATNVP